MFRFFAKIWDNFINFVKIQDIKESLKTETFVKKFREVEKKIKIFSGKSQKIRRKCQCYIQIFYNIRYVKYECTLKIKFRHSNNWKFSSHLKILLNPSEKPFNILSSRSFLLIAYSFSAICRKVINFLKLLIKYALMFIGFWKIICKQQQQAKKKKEKESKVYCKWFYFPGN